MVIVPIPHVRAQAPDSDAQVISFGSRDRPGIQARAKGFRPPDDAGESASTTRNSGTSVSTIPVFVPNRCVGITSGGFDFDLLADVSCGSFAAPPPLPGRTFDPDNPPSPEQLAMLAADRAMSIAPRPKLALSPRSIGLTGLRSFFWVGEDLPTVSAQASIPGMVVEAEARPLQYLGDFGDGSTKTTSSPGRPWTKRRPGNIAHLYETKGRYDVVLEVVWQARWRINGGAWRPLGYFSNSDEVSYPVREMRAMLVRSRH
jgi:hypothetical protein